MQIDHDWITALDAWKLFTEAHPELGYRGGIQQFYNFLRRNRDALVAQDAIRRAKRRFWIAHKHRFIDVAFELSTGGL